MRHPAPPAWWRGASTSRGSLWRGVAVDTSKRERATEVGLDDSTTVRRATAPPLPRVVGMAETESGKYAAVMRLVGIAGSLARALSVPKSRARAAVLERIRGDSAPLFVAHGFNDVAEAVAVSEAQEWRPALRDGRGVWAQLLSKQEQRSKAAVVFVIDPDMGAAEALWRGVPLSADYPSYGAWFETNPLQTILALPALPALHGRAGALEAFAVAAAPEADRSDVPFVAQAQALAIFETDARRIFPEVFGESSPALPQALSHVSPVESLKSTVVPHPKGGTWTEDEKQLVRNLRAAGVTDVLIAKLFDCKRATLHQEVGSRKARTGKGAAAGVVSSVFHMARR